MKQDEKQEQTVVTGELVADISGEDLAVNKAADIAVVSTDAPRSGNQRIVLLYLLLPVIFLTVALLGGLRLNAADTSLIFLKPALLCLIFATILLVLFFRSGLIRLDGWFADDFSILKNTANGAVLLSLFAATTQIFNSLLPEQGLPYWIVAFCFFWTLWNNLFADFDTKKLLQSLGGLFGLAFVAKYLLLANLTAPASESWLGGILENPTQEAFTWLLDLPRFSAGTGYIQFFAAALYLLGLFLFPATTRSSERSL
ncbi:MAG TPA: hypothetical protein VFZ23_11495 [Pyrinomonadaceae bacterium]